MPVDSIGNTLATAKPIFPIVSTQTLTEFVGVDAGTLDANDYYSFKLSRTSSFTLSLTGLSANADVQVLTSTGAIATGTDGSLLSSSNTGTLAESINNILNPGTYYIRVFPGPATDPLNPLTTTPSTNYNLNVAADSNTKTDIVWRNPATGEDLIWVMDGITVTSRVNLQAVSDPNWQIQATGDFNGDGNTDIVWRNYATGQDIFWLMNGTTFLSASYFPSVTDLNWHIQGAGDFNGDGTDDLVWRNYATGENIIWFIKNQTLASSVYTMPMDPSVSLEGVADFNHDGNPDLLWRSATSTTDNNFIWLMKGTTYAGYVSLPSVVDANWQIQGTVDLNNDGNSDILWRNSATGQNLVWFLNGTTYSSRADLPIVTDLRWQATAPFDRSLPAVRADAVGNTTATAFSIGPLNGSGVYQNFIDTTNTSDYYQFSIGSTTQVNLALLGPSNSALNGNLDLLLYDAFGNVVQSSTNGGNAPEAITVNNLIAGTYYIQVVGVAGGSSAYNLGITSNNLPVLVTNSTLTLSEGTASTISNNLLLVTDDNNTPTQLTYALVTPPNPAEGALSLNGAAIAQNSTFTQADINAGKLSYSQNGSETLTDSFVFSVSDGAGGTIGNTTFTIDIIPVNDPPVLVTKQPLTLSEGSAASLSSLNLLVTDVEQTAAQLIYSLNSTPVNGSLLLNHTAIAAGSTFTQADVSSGTKLSYSHNGSETTNDSFSFTVTDGAGGTVALSPQTFSIAVTPVNDPPVLISNQGLTVTEGTAPTITSALLQTSDAEFTGPTISPQLPDQIVYTLSTVPINGTLFVGSNALTVNSTFTQADINNNRLLYNQNGSKTNSDSFVFHVSDGNTVTTDSTFNIIISPVNSPPVLSVDAGLTVSEGTTASIGSTLLQVTDPDNPPPQVKYTLGQPPVNGVLKLNGTALTAGQTFTQQDINTLNRLTYQHNGSETTSDSFSFTASDPFGAAIPTSTFSIAVLPVNDPPTLLSNAGLTLSEGSAASITTTLLDATDVDNLDSQITYTVSTPAHGSLFLGATTVTSFTQADLEGGQLKYVHDGSESTSDSFTFTLSDGTATVAAKTFNIAVIPVNDPPGLSNNLGLTVAEGSTSTIASSALLLTDVDGPGPLTYTLSTGTTNGTLKLNNVALSANQTFTQADIAANRLSYTQNGSETLSDSFSFTASDGSTGLLALNTFSITVTPVNDPPVLTVPGFQSVNEDTPLAFTGSSLISLSDADVGGNPLVVTLTAGGGTLSLNPGSVAVNNNASSAVTLTGTLASVNAALSSLTYQGLLNFNGPDTITITANDQGATGAGGPQTDTKTINVAVIPVNDPPGLSNNLGLTVAEGNTSTIASSALLLTDVDGPGPLTYTLSTGTTNGTLKLNNVALSANQTFTQADIAANRLSYTQNGSETLSDSFSFTASDGSTGLLALNTFSITVTPVNDPPVLTVPGFQSVNEDTPLAFTGSSLISLSDADVGGNPLVVTLTAGGGTLSLNPGSVAVNNNASSAVTLTGTLASVNAALSSLTYQGLLNFNGPDTISLTANDQGATGAGGPQTDTKTINVAVIPVNDPPTLTVPGAQTVLEDTALSLANLIDTTDVDSGTSPVKVSLTALNGTLNLGTTTGINFTDSTANGGSTLSFTGTIASVRTDLATLSYQGNANYFGADTITINVNDQGATGIPGPLSVQKTIAVTVVGVNDAPTFTAGTDQVVNEDALPQNVAWATNLSPGAANEASQTLNFIVSNDNNSLFTTQPTLNPNTGNLSYALAPNANGVANVTVSLHDNGGTANGGVDTSPTTTFKITVNPVNDAPSFTKGANQTVAEDAGSQTVSGWATAISAGPPDEATQALNFLVNVDNPTLFSAGPAIDPTTGNLTYTSAPNANGTAIVTVQLHDNGGTALGGIDTSAPQTFTINVTPVNDPPVFTLPNPQTVSEDTPLSISGLSLTDVDSGSNPLVVTLAVSNGTLALGNTAGLTITAGANNSSSIAFKGTLSNINAALAGLTYQGNLNFNGSDTLSLTANDQGFTGAGPIGIDNETLAISVTPVNDPPVITVPSAQTVNEDTPLALSGINVTDVDAGSSPIKVTLTALNGALTLNPSTSGSTITLTDTLANINAALANLTYQGNLNYNGADTITIIANDQGNTGFGGPLGDTKTISVTVNPVNDPPTLTLPGPQTINENASLVFNSGRAIVLTDVDSGSSPILAKFSVSNGKLTLGAVGSGGTLTGNGTNSLTYTGPLTAITAALNSLTYSSNLYYSGSDTLNVTVNDQGNTGSGPVGIATGSVPITINHVNQPPVLVSNQSLTVSEGTSGRITNAQLRTTDVDNTPDQVVYTLLSAPNPLTTGGLRLANSGGTTATLAAGGTFTQADINSGYLSYAQNGSETTTDSFTFTVADNTPGSITIPSSGNYTFNIAINPVNDAPTLISNSKLSLSEGATSTISNTLLRVSDPDNTTLQLKYTLISAPNNGNLRLNGAALSAGQAFTEADLDSNRISYRQNGSETTSDSFTFVVNDGAGGTTGSKTFNIAISPVNDAPTVISAGPATVNEGATITITNTLLQTSDPDNLTSELKYTLPTVPVQGTLLLNGTPLGAGAVLTQQDINQGALTYVNNGNKPTGNDIFVFHVSDGTTTLSDRIFNIVINPVNQPPVLVSNNGLIVAGDTPSLTVIGNDLLDVTDVDNTPQQLTYTLTSTPNPLVGVLRLNGTALASGQTFTQADIDSGNLSFDYLGNGSGEAFQFTVSDGGVGGTLSNAFFYINFNYS